MSERKVVGRRTGVGLGIVCIVLMALLVGAIAYYTMVVEDKDTAYNNYASDHSHTDSDYEALTNYKNQLETWLAGNITQLSESKLIKINWNEEDHAVAYAPPGTRALTIDGVLMNIRHKPAYNCRLHVVLVQVDGNGRGEVIEDNDIPLDRIGFDNITINGESWFNMGTEVFYEGNALTAWNVTPVWTS